MENIGKHTTYTSFGEMKSPLDPASFKPWVGRAILLVDLDAFFASVEQYDHPEWRGKPVIVGGDPTKRGVVSTASYEARAFGVHSAMPSSTAAKLCPQAIWTHGHFARYRKLSRQVMDILYAYSPHLMQVSIDEAFLDITPTRANQTHPIVIAKYIQEAVDELGITCSIGLGTSKPVAKIASDLEKPHGLTVVYPGDEEAFLFPLKAGVMSGIGPVAQANLAKFGIHTLGDVACANDAILRHVFGKNATMMRNRCHGIDTPIQDEPDAVKSVSNEMSLARSITKRSDIEALIDTTAHKVGRRLRQKGLQGTTLHLKVRFEDLHIKTVQRTLAEVDSNELSWLPLLHRMLDDVWCEGQEARLIGVGVSGFDTHPVQESLFGDEIPSQVSTKEQASLPQLDKKSQTSLLQARDAIADKFGDDILHFGHEIRSYNNVTGSSTRHNHKD